MRVVVLGPGGAGKSTFSRQLAEASGTPWIEIDEIFWQPGLKPLSVEDWGALQDRTFQETSWIADGDLGPYDAVDVRLHHAEVVVLLDMPPWRCAWRSLRRSRERLDYWRWLLTWRWKWRPRLVAAVGHHPHVELLVVRSKDEQRQALKRLVGDP